MAAAVVAAGHTARRGRNPRPAAVEAAVVVTAAAAVANDRAAAEVAVPAAVAAAAVNPPAAVEAEADNEFSGSVFPWARTRSRTGRAIF